MARRKTELEKQIDAEYLVTQIKDVTSFMWLGPFVRLLEGAAAVASAPKNWVENWQSERQNTAYFRHSASEVESDAYRSYVAEAPAAQKSFVAGLAADNVMALIERGGFRDDRHADESGIGRLSLALSDRQRREAVIAAFGAGVVNAVGDPYVDVRENNVAEWLRALTADSRIATSDVKALSEAMSLELEAASLSNSRAQVAGPASLAD